jgi:uncharacterized protein DUF4340
VDKRFFINIGLLVFIAILSFLIINSGEKTNPVLPHISTINQSDIVQIKVRRKNLDDFSFEKRNESWHMIEPQPFLANNARINAILRILKSESHSQLNPADVNLDIVDLKDPTIILELNNHEFRFGNTDAIDQRRYVLFEGKIHLTNDFLYNQLMTNAAFFANPQLLSEETDITSIAYPENKIELVEGQWQLQNLMDISPDQLKRIVFNWKNASALKVSKYEAPETESFITISTTKGETIDFVIVSYKPHLIFGRKDIDIQYEMASEETKKLLLIDNSKIDEETELFDLELR